MRVVDSVQTSLTSRLRAAGRAFQVEEGRSFLSRSLKYFLGVALVLFAIDVVFHVGSLGRFILASVLGLGALVVALWGWYLGGFRQSRLEQVARLVESLEPSLGSKVINILQLEKQAQDDKLPPMTRELARQAVSEYTRVLQGVNFRRIARLPRLKLDLRRAGLAALVFGLLLLAGGPISSTELARYTDPYGDHPAYSFTRLSITNPTEAGARVVYGKSAQVHVTSMGHLPKEVLLTLYDPRRPERKTTVPMSSAGKGSFSQQIENIRSDLVIVAHTANQHSMSHQRHINVILTPKIENTTVEILPPSYTGLKPERKAVDRKPIKALEGSLLRFRLQSNRPLRGGVIESGGQGSKQVSMAKSAENEVAADWRAQNSGPLRFGVVDADGLPSDESFETMLTVTHDLPPVISISNPARDSMVCIDYSLRAQIDATDDYGLKTIRVHCALNGVYFAPIAIQYEKLARTATVMVPLDFYDMDAEPGDVITLFAEAIDTAPSPNTARSQTVSITLISEDDYNQFIRQQSDLTDIELKYTDLLDRFQQKIDEQKQIAKELDQLKASHGKDKDALEATYQDLVDKQSDVNRELEDLADEMDQLVRPDPAYDIESDFRKALNEKARSIRDSTAANDKKMRDLASREPDPNAVSDFKDTAEQQARNLEGTQEKARNDISGTLTDLEKLQELQKDFHQFQDLYDSQKDLETQNRAYNRSGDLSREDQLALRNLATTENAVDSGLRQLADKLREDAKAAESKFPKAAQSGRALADNIEQQRMPPLASEATDAMLKGQGEKSWQSAERLKQEMEKLFSECQSQQEGQEGEMNDYLSLRKMSKGKTFRQMLQSRKYAAGAQKGQGMGSGLGMGMGGSTQGQDPNLDVLGSESRITRNNGAGAQLTHPADAKPGASSLTRDTTDATHGIKSTRRDSDAVISEAPIDQYDTLVESYFKAITK